MSGKDTRIKVLYHSRKLI